MEWLEKIPARAPSTILQKLVETRGLGEKTPAVDIYTSEGMCFRGWALRIESDRAAGDQLLLQGVSNSGMPGEDVVYLPLARVAAVRVHSARMVAKALSFGALAISPGQAVPSRLEIKRQLQAMTELLSREHGLALSVDAAWDGMPAEEASHVALQRLAQALLTTLRKDAGDQMAREAWQKVRAVCFTHRPGAAFASRRQDAEILLEADLTRALPEPIDRALADSLNAAL